MKHILNDLSNEEKNSIREQHTGGMKVMTAKLGNAKPLVNEAEEDDDSGVVVDSTKIDSEDMKCFDDISSQEALKVGLNHGGKYKVKKKGCMTKTRYKGPKTTYRSTNW
jgi:hypothetical protein